MDKILTLKQKDRIVKKVYRSYKSAQLDILYLNQHYNFYPQVDLCKVKENSESYQKPDSSFLIHLERKQSLESFIGVINQVHSHLSKETYFFIENEYLNFYDSTWWLPYFSRASYYRIKHRALDEFIGYLKSFWSEEQILSLLN